MREIKTLLPEYFKWVWAVWFVLLFHSGLTAILAIYLLPSTINFGNRRHDAPTLLGWNLALGWTPMWFLLLFDGIKNANPRTYGVPPPPRPRGA